ncbi:hypothetical protein MBCUT_14070 [Methanobrevibacter cuticularis]|uniref:Ribbon-helix-helix protein CopG domain-containing protein n=1 Tax=Methanobrevibacter cuticularis TaxID=47311 RepID=A0A166DG69_9EURY|nr:ribbon-helix-helix domain-containing protein [Methanobrevibacter cuticularis]KZX15572.1 hypothetical protein MBCUT_14070 [Methanobrevibacter cuticularis]
MALVETKIKIEDKYLKQIEKEAEKEGSSIPEFIKDAINLKLQSKKSKLSFKDLAGRYTTDKPFNVVEDKRKLRNGEL